ncbi:hypothetical protein [Chitinibacter sp. GC72]|uniref:hypothetical protein n=1 Tax=Chitinibacter sp. GC72 TaxID=1526917 RepID=UPI0012F9A4D1|nr:hypothetical protein [Chitinibacter sp. GC72]
MAAVQFLPISGEKQALAAALLSFACMDALFAQCPRASYVGLAELQTVAVFHSMPVPGNTASG